MRFIVVKLTLTGYSGNRFVFAVFHDIFIRFSEFCNRTEPYVHCIITALLFQNRLCGIKIVLFINGVMFVGASFLILLTKPLASFLYAKDFYVAWEYVPMLILSVVINTNSGIYGAILAAKGRSNGMAISSFIGIVVNVALNILLVWAIGMQGVTIATVISGLVILLLRKIISGADFKTKWDKFIYLSLALVVAQSLCKIYIREWDCYFTWQF